MEVDGDRITDDERMDEDDHGARLTLDGEEVDYPVGEGDGMMEDSDGDEMMQGGDEIQDDEEYEVAMEEENVEPIIAIHAQPDPVDTESLPMNEGNIPFTSTSVDDFSKPVISPFPEIASTTSRTVLPKPLESPPAPETEMTPVEEIDQQPFINNNVGVNGEGQIEEKNDETNSLNTFNSTSAATAAATINDNFAKDRIPSPEPEQVATTEEALDVLSHNPEPQSNSNSHTTAEMPLQSIPSVPEPLSSTLHSGESSNRGRSREHTLGKDNATFQIGEEEDEYIDDDAEGEDDVEEDYTIDANSLPPIILHLPNDQARYLFEPYEIDPDTLPIWLQGRQVELAEASLSDVWNAIRIECNKEGLAQNGALVICEKQMDLKMNEDDVNLQSITFLELILLHHGCGLPEPVQLYLSWEESRFITRFNAIEAELEAVKRRSESVQGEVEEKQVEPPSKEASKAVEHSPKPVEKAKDVVEDEAYEEEYDEDEYVEEEEIKSKQGAYSDDEEKVERNAGDYAERDRRRDQRDVKAQYAESVDDEVNTRDLERAHPNWAAARVKPTDALHFEGPAGRKYLNYKAEGHHRDEAEKADDDEVDHHNQTKERDTTKEIANNEEEDDDVEDQYDEEERDDDVEEGGEWNDGADTVDATSIAQSQETNSQNDMNDVTIPPPAPLDEVAKLRAQREAQRKATEILQREELRDKKLVEPEPASTFDVSALPTPIASVAPSEIDIGTAEAGYDELDSAARVPQDEIELKHQEEEEYSEAISPDYSTANLSVQSGMATPAMSTLTPTQRDEAIAIAKHVAQPTIEIIREDDESIGHLAERVNGKNDTEELNAPVDGVAGVGIVPPSGDEGYFSSDDVHDTKYDYDDDDVNEPVTVPVTPLESGQAVSNLEFTGSSKVVLDDDDDETYGSDREGTLEADPEYGDGVESTEDGFIGHGDTEYPTEETGTSVSGFTESEPLSAKRRQGSDNVGSDSFDVESKRAKTTTSD